MSGNGQGDRDGQKWGDREIERSGVQVVISSALDGLSDDDFT